MVVSSKGDSMALPLDLDIARAASLEPIADIAAEMGIGPHLIEEYGDSVAKIKLDAIEELADRPRAKYVLVSAITPTPLGEGKTTTAVGLAPLPAGMSSSATRMPRPG